MGKQVAKYWKKNTADGLRECVEPSRYVGLSRAAYRHMRGVRPPNRSRRWLGKFVWRPRGNFPYFLKAIVGLSNSCWLSRHIGRIMGNYGEFWGIMGNCGEIRNLGCHFWCC